VGVSDVERPCTDYFECVYDCTVSIRTTEGICMSILYTALIISCIPVAYVLYLVYKLLRELDDIDKQLLDNDDV